jgi:hypothetical protein
MPLILSLAIILAGEAAAASAQTTSVEVQQSLGVSSESIAAAATQLRVIGQPRPRFRFELEASLGARSGGQSDVFGTAYPYSGRQVMEAYAEYISPDRVVRSVRGGRYRTPFGISAASEHAYIGFLRPPLIRYGDYFALSNGYLEHGLDVVVGAAGLAVELSVGKPADVGEAVRRSGLTTVTRIEAAFETLIVGGSFINTTPYLPAHFARGVARFGGVDVRWMKDGIHLRGEWLGGRPFAGTTTTGGYVDLLLHRPWMGPVTTLVRAERLDYVAQEPFSLETTRYQAAARIRVWRGLSVSAGAAHQNGQLTQTRRTAVDVGLSYAVRTMP